MNRFFLFFLTVVLLTASGAAGEATVSIENNTQRAGSDYTNFVTDGPQQCAQECGRDPRCMAFDFSTYDRLCWLKSGIPQARYNRDVISGVKQSYATTGQQGNRIPRVPGMRIQPDTQRPFGDYTNFGIENVKRCAEECVRDARCLAFDYSKHDKRCWLKNNVPPARHNIDVISGVKNRSTPEYVGNGYKKAFIRIEPDTQRAFGDYTNFAVENVERCAEECVRDTRCLALDYSRHDSRCWLKSSVPHPRHNVDVISGVKQWSYGADRKSYSTQNTSSSRSQSASTVRQFDTRVQVAQEILQKEGYAPGTADGILGSKTRKALRKFQKNHNLSPSGNLDDETYNLLLQLKAEEPVG